MLVLKGLGLNALLYGETCIRASNDIDLFINKTDLLKAHHCLSELGFQLSIPLTIHQLTHELQFLTDAMNEMSYIHHDYHFRIDLHWQLTMLPMISYQPLLDPNKQTTVKFHQNTIPILEHHHHFLYLCVHAALHRWHRLHWLVDLAVFYQKIPLHWPRLLALAQQYHAIRPLLEAKQLLQDEFQLNINTTIPCTRMDQWACYWHLRSARRLWHHLFKIRYIDYFYMVFLFPSLSHKKRFLLNLILIGQLSLRQLAQYPQRSTKQLIWCSLLQEFILLKREQ